MIDERRRALMRGAATSIASLLFGAAARAKAPWKPTALVTLVVPYAAGGGTDTVARLLAQRLALVWGVQVIVDNRPGANGTIGALSVSRAAPDGRTIMLALSSMSINPYVMKALPYKTEAAFTPISQLARSAVVMVVSPSVKEPDLVSFLAAARRAPGTRNFGSSEPSSRLYGEYLKVAANVDLVNIPYKGGGPMLNDLFGGALDSGFTSIATSIQHLNAGKLRAFAVATTERHKLLPTVPTFHELGIAMPAFSWQGIFGPPGLDPAVTDGIYEAIKAAIADNDTVQSFEKIGIRGVGTSPQEFAKFFLDQLASNRALVAKAGIVPE